MQYACIADGAAAATGASLGKLMRTPKGIRLIRIEHRQDG